LLDLPVEVKRVNVESLQSAEMTRFCAELFDQVRSIEQQRGPVIVSALVHQRVTDVSVESVVSGITTALDRLGDLPDVRWYSLSGADDVWQISVREFTETESSGNGPIVIDDVPVGGSMISSVRFRQGLEGPEDVEPGPIVRVRSGVPANRIGGLEGLVNKALRQIPRSGSKEQPGSVAIRVNVVTANELLEMDQIVRKRLSDVPTPELLFVTLFWEEFERTSKELGEGPEGPREVLLGIHHRVYIIGNPECQACNPPRDSFPEYFPGMAEATHWVRDPFTGALLLLPEDVIAKFNAPVRISASEEAAELSAFTVYVRFEEPLKTVAGAIFPKVFELNGRKYLIQFTDSLTVHCFEFADSVSVHAASIELFAALGCGDLCLGVQQLAEGFRFGAQFTPEHEYVWSRSHHIRPFRRPKGSALHRS
jgi:hypothetical protein